MKGIRTIALGLALLAGATATAQAQDPAPQGGQRRGGMGMGVAPLLEGITLTAEQQTKVDSIQKAFQPKTQALREEMQGGGDRAQLMQKMRSLNAEMRTAVRALLTAEQQAAFDKNVEAMEARRRQMMQNRPAPR